MAVTKELTAGQLSKLQTLLQTSEKAVDVDYFTAALQSVLGAENNIDAKMGKLIFDLVDADGDGNITWREFQEHLQMLRREETQEAQWAQSKECVSDEVIESTNLTRFNYHSAPINKVFSLPKVGKLMTSSFDGSVRLWNPTTLEPAGVLHYTTHGGIDTYYDPASDLALVANCDKTVSLYDIDSMKLLRSFQLGKAATGDIHDIYRQQLRVPEQTPKFLFNGAPAPELDGSTLKRCWEAANSRLLQRVWAHRVHFDQYKATSLPLTNIDVSSVACYSNDPSSAHMILGLANGVVQHYQPRISRGVVELEIEQRLDPTVEWPLHTDGVTRIYCDAAREQIITSSMDSNIHISHIELGITLKTLKGTPEGTIRSHSRGVRGFEVSHMPNLIASYGSERFVILWDPHVGKPLHVLHGHSARLVDVKFSPQDDNMIFTYSDNLILRVWDMRTLRCIQQVRDHAWNLVGKPSSIYYDASTKCILTCASRLYGKDAVSPELRQERDSHSLPVVSIAYCMKENILMSSDEESIRQWNSETGEISTIWKRDAVRNVVLDNKGFSLLVDHGTEDVQVVSSNSGDAQIVLSGTGDVLDDMQFLHWAAEFWICLTSRRMRFYSSAQRDSKLVYFAEHTHEFSTTTITGRISSAIIVADKLHVGSTLGYMYTFPVGFVRHSATVTAYFTPINRLHPRVVESVPLLQSFHIGELHTDVLSIVWRAGCSNAFRNLKISLSGSTDVLEYTGKSRNSIEVMARITDNVLCTGSSNGRLSLWNVRQKQELFQWQATILQSIGVTSMDVSADGTILFIGDDMGYVGVFDMTDFVTMISGDSVDEEEDGVVATFLQPVNDASDLQRFAERIKRRSLYRGDIGSINSMKYMELRSTGAVLCIGTATCRVVLISPFDGTPLMVLGGMSSLTAPAHSPHYLALHAIYQMDVITHFVDQRPVTEKEIADHVMDRYSQLFASREVVAKMLHLMSPIEPELFNEKILERAGLGVYTTLREKFKTITIGTFNKEFLANESATEEEKAFDEKSEDTFNTTLNAPVARGLLNLWEAAEEALHTPAPTKPFSRQLTSHVRLLEDLDQALRDASVADSDDFTENASMYNLNAPTSAEVGAIRRRRSITSSSAAPTLPMRRDRGIVFQEPDQSECFETEMSFNTRSLPRQSSSGGFKRAMSRHKSLLKLISGEALLVFPGSEFVKALVDVKPVPQFALREMDHIDRHEMHGRNDVERRWGHGFNSIVLEIIARTIEIPLENEMLNEFHSIEQIFRDALESVVKVIDPCMKVWRRMVLMESQQWQWVHQNIVSGHLRIISNIERPRIIRYTFSDIKKVGELQRSADDVKPRTRASSYPRRSRRVRRSTSQPKRLAFVNSGDMWFKSRQPGPEDFNAGHELFWANEWARALDVIAVTEKGCERKALLVRGIIHIFSEKCQKFVDSIVAKWDPKVAAQVQYRWVFGGIAVHLTTNPVNTFCCTSSLHARKAASHELKSISEFVNAQWDAPLRCHTPLVCVVQHACLTFFCSCVLPLNEVRDACVVQDGTLISTAMMQQSFNGLNLDTPVSQLSIPFALRHFLSPNGLHWATGLRRLFPVEGPRSGDPEVAVALLRPELVKGFVHRLCSSAFDPAAPIAMRKNADRDVIKAAKKVQNIQIAALAAYLSDEAVAGKVLYKEGALVLHAHKFGVNLRYLSQVGFTLVRIANKDHTTGHVRTKRKTAILRPYWANTEAANEGGTTAPRQLQVMQVARAVFDEVVARAFRIQLNSELEKMFFPQAKQKSTSPGFSNLQSVVGSTATMLLKQLVGTSDGSALFWTEKLIPLISKHFPSEDFVDHITIDDIDPRHLLLRVNALCGLATGSNCVVLKCVSRLKTLHLKPSRRGPLLNASSEAFDQCRAAVQQELGIVSRISNKGPEHGWLLRHQFRIHAIGRQPFALHVNFAHGIEMTEFFFTGRGTVDMRLAQIVCLFNASHYDLALVQVSQIARLYPNSAHHLAATSLAIDISNRLGNHADTISESETLLKLCRKLFDGDRVCEVDVANALSTLATAYMATASSIHYQRQARELLLERLHILSKMFSPGDVTVLAALSDLAEAHIAMEEEHEAIALYDKLLVCGNKWLGPASTFVMDVLTKMGRACVQLRNFKAAETVFSKLLYISEEHYGHQLDLKAVAHLNLCNMHLASGNVPGAAQEMKVTKSIALGLPFDDKVLLMQLEVEAKTQMSSGDFTSAFNAWTKILDARERTVGPMDASTCDAMFELGVIMFRQKKFHESWHVFDVCLTMRKQVLGPQHPLTAFTMSWLARSEAASGNMVDAVELFQASTRLFDAMVTDTTPVHVSFPAMRAQCLIDIAALILHDISINVASSLSSLNNIGQPAESHSKPLDLKYKLVLGNDPQQQSLRALSYLRVARAITFANLQDTRHRSVRMIDTLIGECERLSQDVRAADLAATQQQDRTKLIEQWSRINEKDAHHSKGNNDPLWYRNAHRIYKLQTQTH